jgi:hypothetical protein
MRPVLPVLAAVMVAAASSGFRVTDLDRTLISFLAAVAAAVIVKLIDGIRDRRRYDLERRNERLVRENQRLRDNQRGQP